MNGNSDQRAQKGDEKMRFLKRRKDISILKLACGVLVCFFALLLVAMNSAQAYEHAPGTTQYATAVTVLQQPTWTATAVAVTDLEHWTTACGAMMALFLRHPM